MNWKQPLTPDPTLIVGLGNPGAQYERTRHNAGFMLCDLLAARAGVSVEKNFNGSLYAQTSDSNGNKIYFLKPQKFMNLSGQTLAPFLKYYGVPLGNCVVLHDEIDFDFGRLALKEGGGHGGHNGLRDIIAQCGSPNFKRLRFGVGRPTHPDVAGYVLSPFSAPEATRVGALLAEAAGLLAASHPRWRLFANGA